MARRSRFGFLATGAFVLFVFLYWTMAGGSSAPSAEHPLAAKAAAKAAQAAEETAVSTTTTTTSAVTAHEAPAAKAAVPVLSDDVLTGGVIAPKLGNETAKQELGRASWRLLHTMMARFPEKPTADESLALRTFVQLFARLYPCGECAAHFQALLAEFPPQTSGRNAAAGWACFVHNEVNARLGKALFDCNNIGDFYDCGCGEEGKGGEKGAVPADGDTTAATAEAVLGGKARPREAGPIALEREEGLSRGG